jgi:hypothetical protein
MEITSKMIIKADGTSDQNIKKGTGIKTPHIQKGAVTKAKIRNDSISSSKIREADGTTGQNPGRGFGIKTPHIQDGAVTTAKIKDEAVSESKIANGAVTEKKLAENVKGKLVANGNSHDHSGGDGAKINHSSLNKDDGRNPHGTTAADVGAASESYVNNYVNTKGYAAKSYVDDKYNDNRGYINTKTAGTFSSTTNIENVTTSHTKQVNASYVSTSKGYLSQVNASHGSIASGDRSQVNASINSKANGSKSQVNAANYSAANGTHSQVNASNYSVASGHSTQVNASDSSTAGGSSSQVNASIQSKTSKDCSQVNASVISAASHGHSQVNASSRVETKSAFTVCGGWGGSGPSNPNNIKWQLDSYSGNITHAGSLRSHASFSDYGEYFENLTNGEIDMGTIIALEGAKVRPAKKDEDFIGVVSGTAAIRLGDSPFCWQGRYMKDEWGRAVYEEIKDPAWGPKKVPDEKWEPKEGETEADRPMTPVESEKDRPTIRVQKENPDYDPEKEQIPRSERPKEWTLVGLLGQVYVRCDGTVKPGDFVKSKDKGIGTKSEEKTKLRAMKVTKEFDGKYSIVYCLLN